MLSPAKQDASGDILSPAKQDVALRPVSFSLISDF